MEDSIQMFGKHLLAQQRMDFLSHASKNINKLLGRDVFIEPSSVRITKFVNSLMFQTKAFNEMKSNQNILDSEQNKIFSQNLENYQSSLHQAIRELDQRINALSKKSALSSAVELPEIEHVRAVIVNQLAALTLGTEKIVQIQSLVNELFKPEDPGCSLAIMQGGKIIWECTCGMADPLTKEIRLQETPQHIGSVSKQFTAMCVAILVDRGKIDLEKDIRLCIPILKNLPQLLGPDGTPVEIKVKHLLHMQSGLPDSVAIVEFNGKKDQDLQDKEKLELVIQFLSQNPKLAFVPGEKYGYSNTNYILLAELVADRCDEKSYRDFAQNEIFSKLGMKQTSFIDPDPTVIVHMLKGFNLEKGKWVECTTRNRTSGACGVVGTVRDIAKWDENFTHPQLGDNPQHVLEIMRGPFAPPENVPFVFEGPLIKDAQYLGGLVVGRSMDNKFAIEAHPGGIEGFGAKLYRLRDLSGNQLPITVFMAFNRNHGEENPTQIATKILEICVGSQIEPVVPKPPKLQEESSTTTLEQYCGNFSNPISGKPCEIIIFENDNVKQIGLRTTPGERPFIFFKPDNNDKDLLLCGKIKLRCIREDDKLVGYELDDDVGGLKNIVFSKL
jgi:CubicO group peptidase (beta-lactamase class C family)